MAGRRELLEEWRFPYIERSGVTLVTRADAPACVELIYSNNCCFYGYDAFTVTAGHIQPHLDWSPSWKQAPALNKVLSQIASHPPEVTHYEFVFQSVA
jgi:hypothetical protein